MSKSIKTAFVTRVAGDLYDVTYSDDAACNRMPWRSVESLRRMGYTVQIAGNSQYGDQPETRGPLDG